MTCGPWRPIHLEVFASRIVDVSTRVNLTDNLQTAYIDLRAEIEGEYETVLFDISLEGEDVVRQTVSASNDTARVVFRTNNPALWYPRGYGKQSLYVMVVTIFDRDFRPLDTLTKRIGIRDVKVKTQKLEDEEGSTFAFEVNSIPIFCGGSNWIPADSFLTRMGPTRYQAWVDMLARGNQIMLRVWGGGIYEDDAFYDACDEAGVLVWQDFMFACGNYPATPKFLDSVKEEAIANVRRLRTHPCIVIWAGNNEDYQIAEDNNLEYHPQDNDPQRWLESNFPARYIYEKLLKDVMLEHAPGTYYHYGSPFGGKSSGDSKIGDIHQWNVWHGTQERYQDWDKLAGRFVSEFGMQALPDMRTVEQFFHSDDETERFAESSTVSFHNKAVGHDRRLGIYLTENLCYRFHPFEYYTYCTQVMQAECVASAFRLWKRQWKDPGREYCAGALVWQSNDCWPCTSWSIVDYHRRPKLAYYAIKREMNGLTLGLRRVLKERTQQSRDEDMEIPPNTQAQRWHEIELWACNLTPCKMEAKVSIQSYHLDTGGRKCHPELSQTITIPPSRSIEINRFAIPAPASAHDQTVIVAMLSCPGKQEARPFFNWPEPLKYAHLPHPLFELLLSPDKQELGYLNLRIRANAPAKSVVVEIEGEDTAGADLLDDNGFDMAPHIEKTVKVRAPKGHEKRGEIRVRLRYLGCERDHWVEVEWDDEKTCMWAEYPPMNT